MSAKGKIIDLEGYKRQKYGLDSPIFTEPTKIFLNEPSDTSRSREFTVICNAVYDGRQFLALEQEEEEEKRHTLVEAITDRGSLVKVVPIAEHEYSEVKDFFAKIYDKASKYQ